VKWATRKRFQWGSKRSLTGHLVFATLHTNSAPESIARLLDMGTDMLRRRIQEHGPVAILLAAALEDGC
jgi:Tfp pilus assembly pilus retraction ATPase PilT